MRTLTKIFAGTAIGASVVAAVSYFSRLKRAQVQLEVVPNASIHSLSWTGLTIRVDALLKNPSGANFKVKFPYLKVYQKDTVLGSSQVVNKDISIPAYGQVLIESIMVQISTLSLLSAAYSLIKALNNNEPVALVIEIITTIDLGWSKLPYSSKMEVTLKK
jgi:hypothetical protein